MVIQHNMQAQNGNRIFKKVNREKGRESERLGSGYRINRAADDAAGLSMSEKLRTQIRGLHKAEDNIQNGISLLQTADGALGEVTDIVQRMRELCVQGANDTYVEADREAIQKELYELSNCIDDILEYTEFNTMKILKLGEAYIDYRETIVGTLPSNVTVSGNLQSGSFPPLSTALGVTYSFAAIDFSSLQTAADVQTLIDTGFHTTCCTCDNKYNIRFTNNQSTPSVNVGRNPVFDVNISGITNGAGVVNAIVNSVRTNHFTEFMANPQNSSVLYIYDNRWGQTPDIAHNRGIVKPELIRTDAVIDDPANLQIQAGANAMQLIQMDLPTLSSAILGVDLLGVENNFIANNSLERVDMALEDLNGERSKIGALQNRLEYAYSYAENAEENQQAAESLLRDNNMAESMMKFVSADILSQVSQSMISQANQNSETVLSLLR